MTAALDSACLSCGPVVLEIVHLSIWGIHHDQAEACLLYCSLVRLEQRLLVAACAHAYSCHAACIVHPMHVQEPILRQNRSFIQKLSAWWPLSGAAVADAEPLLAGCSGASQPSSSGSKQYSISVVRCRLPLLPVTGTSFSTSCHAPHAARQV